jgi:hypothetical protein
LPALLHDHFAPPYPELAELLDMLLLVKSGLALIRLRDELKYSESQPRWPEGDPRGGQWRPKEGGEGETSQGLEGGIDETVQIAANDGTPGNNQAQNKQVNDVVKVLGLTRDQRKELHLEIAGQNFGFQEILRIGREIKGK